MKITERDKLIGYAMHFASFITEHGLNARKIILFGSVASGEFDEESDIDLFIDTDKKEVKKTSDSLLKAQRNFETSFGEKWRLKGVTNQLSVTTGDINSREWEDLRRTVQSYGITLYGHYEPSPEGVKPFALLRLNFKGIGRPKKVSIWRKLYGYMQKVGDKRYKTTGLLERLSGTKIDKGVILVPLASAAEIKSFLGKSKVSFKLVEVWSDQLP